MSKKKQNDFDREEEYFLKDFENGEFKQIDHLGEAKYIAEQAAVNFFKKDARINIRLSSNDLMRLKRIAANEGLPYQTLISSVLHKYAAGSL